jgi:F-type H+-transporting ATPase subunit gamma
MANLKEVKDRISSIKSTQQITKAMKMVAAAKLRRAQDRILQLRPYAQKLTAILQNVSAGADESMVNEYAVEREVNNVLIVVVSSDKGLCGAFNSNVFKRTRSVIEEKYAEQQRNGGIHILPIGKKATEYFARRDYQMITDFKDTFLDLSFDTARKAAEFAMDGFKRGEFDRVEIIYNEFKNVATQILVTEQFLPVVPAEAEAEVVTTAESIDYVYEPNKTYIVEELIPKSLKIQFYKAVLESNASEHGARMTAMDQATDNAGELLKELRLTYNRTRQAAITTELTEIVAGANALEGA